MWKPGNAAKALLTLCGVGPVTASAAVATAGNVSVFKNGREFAAWLGLLVVKLISIIKNQEPLYTVEALDALFNGNKCISSAKAYSGLNYTVRPFEETIHDSFHWFKDKGYLD